MDWSSPGARIVLFIIAAVYVGSVIESPRSTILGTLAVIVPVSLVYGTIFLLHEELGLVISLIIGVLLAAGALMLFERFMKVDKQ